MKLRSFFQHSIFLLVIFLSVMELFQVAPGDMKFFKEMLSWVLIGFFLYYLSITKTLFNDKNEKIDILIIIAFYLFAFKNLSHIIVNEELNYFNFLRSFLFKYQVMNEIMFQLGSVLIFILAIFMGIKVNYKANSLLGMIRKKRSQDTIGDKIIDTVTIYLTLLAFSYFIFTIVMEWFALALDSYFVVTALAYYFVIYYVFKKNRSFGSFIKSVVETGENLIKKFLNLFHSEETIFFGVTGVIVIHALVDIGNFLLPYLLNIEESFYLSNLVHASHRTIMSLIKEDLAGQGILQGSAVVLAYLGNIVAIFFLLFLPFYIWMKIVGKKEIVFSKLHLSIFFSSVMCFIFAPVFKVDALRNMAMIGADITTNPLKDIGNIDMIIVSAILWFVIILMIGSIEKIKDMLAKIMVFMSLAFLGQYIYYFYSSTLSYYLSNIKYLLGSYSLITAFYLIIYLVVITLFYVAGFILFVFEIMNSEHISFIKLNIELQKKIIFVWSFILIMGFIYLINVGKTMDLTILIISSLMLSLVLLRYEKKPAHYILTVNVVLVSFLAVMPFAYMFSNSIELMELMSRVILGIILLIIVILSKSKLSFKLESPKKIILAVIMGLIFGFWFYLLREPGLPLLFNNLGYMVFLSLLIGINEEIMFRGLLLRNSLDLYSPNSSLIIQGLFFGFLHLMNFKSFLLQFGYVRLLSLFLSLVIFGIIMGILTIDKKVISKKNEKEELNRISKSANKKRSENQPKNKLKEEKEIKINPSYAILCHTLTVILLNLLSP